MNMNIYVLAKSFAHHLMCQPLSTISSFIYVILLHRCTITHFSASDSTTILSYAKIITTIVSPVTGLSLLYCCHKCTRRHLSHPRNVSSYFYYFRSRAALNFHYLWDLKRLTRIFWCTIKFHKIYEKYEYVFLFQ